MSAWTARPRPRSPSPSASTSRRCLDIHRALLGDDAVHGQDAGRLREQLVWVGRRASSPVGAGFVAPEAEDVPAAMEDLLDFVARTDLPPLLHAALAHAQFETIHPFTDGNGRTGRALVHAMLRGTGLLRTVTAPVSAGLLRDVTGCTAVATPPSAARSSRILDSHRPRRRGTIAP
ncbi:hypothetical protein GCM10028787_14830 [Brachybacterium horti]